MRRLLSALTTAMARIRGAKIGARTLFAPGYDWIFASWKGVHVGSDVVVGRRAWIQTTKNNAQIHVGDRCSIGRDVVISAADSIHIGRDCLFSYRVSILDHDHKFVLGESPVGSEIGKSSPVKIGDRTFVGANVTILKGTTIGSDCVVGANSVVRGDFPTRSVIAGNPAKVINTRGENIE